MDHVNENGDGSVRNSIRFVLLVLVLILVILVLSVSEPTKVVLLGVGLIGIAIWARRTFKVDRRS